MSFLKGKIRFFSRTTPLILIVLLLSPFLFADPLRVERSGQLENWFSSGGTVFGMQSSNLGAAVDLGVGSWTPIYNGGKTLGVPLRPPIAGQPDGGIVGVPLTPDTNHMIWRYINGVGVDPNFSAPPIFSAPALPNRVTAITAQSDGKVLVGVSRGLYRLTTNGLADPNFNLGGAFLNGPVTSILIAADGKIVVATTGNIQRFMTNGSPDNSFSISTFQFGNCNGTGFQPNGMILAAGTFDQVNFIPHGGVVRFDTFGNVDFAFPKFVSGITSIGVQQDGSFMLGDPVNVRRFFADGKPDVGFAPPRRQGSGQTYSAIDPTGRIYYSDESSGGDTTYQYSGHSRIVVPSAGINTILQHSAAVAGPWAPIQSMTAGMSTDVLLPEQNSTGNEFFRLEPAQ